MSAAPLRRTDDTAPLPPELLDAWYARSPAAAPSPPATFAGRALSLFVAPRPEAAEPVPVAMRFAPRVAVLGSAADAPPVAAALANALRRRERAAAAVVLSWPAEPPRSHPAAPAAARLAARLAARGLPAAPRGRLAWVGLADPPTTAARRLAGAVEVPLVVALGGARTEAVEELLREQDLVAVVTREPEGPLAQLALTSLHVPAVALPPLGGAARRLALAGLGGARTHAAGAEGGPMSSRGQASILVVGGLAGLLVGALILGVVARAVGEEGGAQRAADLGALAGARAMHAAYPRLFEAATIADRPNPGHLDRVAYLALGRRAAEDVARANGADAAAVTFPDSHTFAPVRIAVAVSEDVRIERGKDRREAEVRGRAEAELVPAGAGLVVAGGGYDGPLAYRQGKPMRPDVAQAFDRMERAAKADGVALSVTSGFRSDAEQAELFRRHPDPRWVAPPGHSLHRYGTELDLGPRTAYAWLAANGERFHFVQRYSWEPWHWGYTLNARATIPATSADGRSGKTLPDFVPARFAPLLTRAAQRWNVSAALLAAQLYAESNFNPFAVSGAGAQGIAQFMPGTAAALGLGDPFDADRAIDAQAHLMRDLLRRFASISLALAAYNAGSEPVAACGCVPPFPETQGYVARILGLLGGAGEPVAAGLTVRLVR